MCCIHEYHFVVQPDYDHTWCRAACGLLVVTSRFTEGSVNSFLIGNRRNKVSSGILEAKKHGTETWSLVRHRPVTGRIYRQTRNKTGKINVKDPGVIRSDDLTLSRHRKASAASWSKMAGWSMPTVRTRRVPAATLLSLIPYMISLPHTTSSSSDISFPTHPSSSFFWVQAWSVKPREFVKVNNVWRSLIARIDPVRHQKHRERPNPLRLFSRGETGEMYHNQLVENPGRRGSSSNIQISPQEPGREERLDKLILTSKGSSKKTVREEIGNIRVPKLFK